MLTYENFISGLWAAVNKCPTNWRQGQKVFNVIDEVYGIARDVQFKDGVDCFYDDKKIDEFIEKAWNRIKTTEYWDSRKP